MSRGRSGSSQSLWGPEHSIKESNGMNYTDYLNLLLGETLLQQLYNYSYDQQVNEQLNTLYASDIIFPTAGPYRGNIDIFNRPLVQLPTGETATVRTAGQTDQYGRIINYPTIGPNGEDWSMQEGWDNYLRTGQHLGIYDTIEEADRAAEELHLQQEHYYLSGRKGGYSWR